MFILSILPTSNNYNNTTPAQPDSLDSMLLGSTVNRINFMTNTHTIRIGSRTFQVEYLAPDQTSQQNSHNYATSANNIYGDVASNHPSTNIFNYLMRVLDFVNQAPQTNFILPTPPPPTNFIPPIPLPVTPSPPPPPTPSPATPPPPESSTCSTESLPPPPPVTSSTPESSTCPTEQPPPPPPVTLSTQESSTEPPPPPTPPPVTPPPPPPVTSSPTESSPTPTTSSTTSLTQTLQLSYFARKSVTMNDVKVKGLTALFYSY